MRLFIYEWLKLRFYGLSELLEKVLALWRNVYWVKTELDNLSRTNFNKLNYCSSQNKYPRTRNVLNQEKLKIYSLCQNGSRTKSGLSWSEQKVQNFLFFLTFSLFRVWEV